MACHSHTDWSTDLGDIFMVSPKFLRVVGVQGDVPVSPFVVVSNGPKFVELA